MDLKTKLMGGIQHSLVVIEFPSLFSLYFYPRPLLSASASASALLKVTAY